MKNPELYNRTVDILVQAYFNDTLEHGNCKYCAVGNIVGGHNWSNVFFTANTKGSSDSFLLIRKGNGLYQEVLKEQKKRWDINAIQLCGYRLQELAQIEFAFEAAYQGENKEDWMFNGLMSVIDALDIIHENTDAHTTKETKLKFNKPLSINLID